MNAATSIRGCLAAPSTLTTTLPEPHTVYSPTSHRRPWPDPDSRRWSRA